MAIARVQLPDGRIGRFEVPDGTSPEQAKLMIDAQLPTVGQAPSQSSMEPRPKTGVMTAPSVKEPSTWSKVRPYVAPVVEFLGAAGGSLVGAGAGTLVTPGVGTAAGGVAGAGLGYGAAKEVLELADRYAGDKAPRQGAAKVTTPLRNVAEGATFEMGGQIAGKLIGQGAGRIADLSNFSKNKAARIARNALGPDLPEALNALAAARGKNISAAQATADINSPTWQALLDRAVARDPRFMAALEKSQGEVSLNALARVAAGSTAAQVRSTTEMAKEGVRSITTPMREGALSLANLGKEVANLEKMSVQLSEEASRKVQEVRRLMELGDLAKASSRLNLIKRDLPVGLTKYTYFGELGERATGEWSDKAAKASLDLGQGARTARDAAGQLRSAGIEPLKSAPIIQSVRSIRANPEFTDNDILHGALRRVKKSIAKNTDADGIIDAVKLDSILKNSVARAIGKMRPGVDDAGQKKLAAGVLSHIKPVVREAIDTAGGGTAYSGYAKEHARLSQQVAEKELGGEALRLWNTNKDAFVRLVQNESPDTVEKILGPGKYDIAKNLTDDMLRPLENEARKIIQAASIKSQVAGGQEALKELLLQNMSKFHLPSYLSAIASTTNKALTILENKIGHKTMVTMTEASKTPEGALRLLERLPAAERNRVLKIISDPKSWGAPIRAATTGAVAVGANAMTPYQQPENEFVR